MNVPATGGAYVRLLPLGFQKWAINQMLQDSIPVVLNVHPWELDPDQPRFPVSRRTQWTHYHNLGQTADRLDHLLDLAEFTSLRVLLAEALRKAS
ncbi:MAG: DUF3473 domain-containing protein, partial [Candidatus Eisenbacteria bacterium]|nr:DUF3473 domain-containing protein [Candidatus Eisenbacteria bacterium]